MHQVYGSSVYSYFFKLVRELPLPVGYGITPHLQALFTFDEESYLLSIAAPPYTFSALSFLGDTEGRVFFDLASTMALVSINVENALTEYDMQRIREEGEKTHAQ